jgi:hypothetical protein
MVDQHIPEWLSLFVKTFRIRTVLSDHWPKLENAAMVVSSNADQFGEGLSILSITITSTTALVG